MRKILVEVLLGVLITTISGFSTAKAPSKNQSSLNRNSAVTHDWQLILSKNEVRVTQTITNHLSHAIYLPPDALPIGVWRVKDKFELPEIGLQERRTPYTLDEFIKLSPYDSHTFAYKLHEIYGFPKGCYEYEMRMSNGYFYPDERRVVNLGIESKKFIWCNPTDPFHGFFKDPLKINTF